MSRLKILYTRKFGVLSVDKSDSSCSGDLTLLRKPCVLFYGAAGLDILTFVKSFPKPDQKVRAIDQCLEGGGNSANSAVAASKLNIEAHLCTKLGNDQDAEVILNGLVVASVNTKNVLRSTSSKSGVTYVIVCQESGTRTCIHTAMTDEITEDELITAFQICSFHSTGGGEGGTSSSSSRSSFSRPDSKSPLLVYDLIHLDSRHTQAAIVLAKEAQRQGIMVSIDFEKERPYLFDLLPYCDVIFMNRDCSGMLYPLISDRTVRLLKVLREAWAQHCKLLVCTLGEEGSVLIATDAYLNAVNRKRPSSSHQQDIPSSFWNHTAHISEPAAVNESENGNSWSMLETDMTHFGAIRTDSSKLTCPDSSKVYNVIRCSAFPLTSTQIRDSTGAGDTFIAGFIAGFLHGWALENCMKLGTLAAAQKLQQLGSRAGQPTFSRIQALVHNQI